MMKKWQTTVALLLLQSTVVYAQPETTAPVFTAAPETVATPRPGSPGPESMESLDSAPVLAAVGIPAAGNASSGSSIFGISASQVTADLQQRLQVEPQPQSLQAGTTELLQLPLVLDFYRRRGYQPAWINDAGKPSQLAEQLSQAIDDSVQDGLRPTFYNFDDFRTAMRSLKIAFAPTPRQLSDFDLLLTDTYFQLADHLVTGRLEPSQVEEYWKLKPRQIDLVGNLQQAVVKRDILASLSALSSPHAGYARLRQALSDYRQLAANGGWPAVNSTEKLELGSRGVAVQQLRARLRASGDLSGPDAVDPAYFDAILQDAVVHFQERHGLTADGVVGPNTLRTLNVPIAQRIRAMELNLERWRWLPETLGERYIEVNIPGYQLRLVEQGEDKLKARVIVGRSKRPTPIFSADMSYLVFSPYWYVPRTIMVEDKLPILRKNPYALRKQGIRIFSGNREIDPGSVNWSNVSKRSFSYSMRQDPGKYNALGDIKFMFPNQHSVYIHDTSSPRLFERDQRAFSSGCVRIDSPVELAEYLLRDTKWDRDTIVKASQRGRERRVDLQTKVPVYMLYWTSWVDSDGTVQFRDDIYDRDTALAQALFSS